MRSWTCAGLAAALAASVSPARAESELETEVLEVVNMARQQPRAMAAALRDYRDGFTGRVAHPRGDPVGVMTNEGVGAVDEAIRFLERQAPLPPLRAGRILGLAAQDHADGQGRDGRTGHVSADGASPGARVQARGGGIYVGETIAYGPLDALDMVRALIVDDGQPRRGHRALLFSPAFRFAGVGCAPHRRYGGQCVIDLSATADGRPAPPRLAEAGLDH